MKPKTTKVIPQRLQIKVMLKGPMVEQFLRLREALGEDNAGLMRVALRECIERRQPAQQPAQASN